MRPGSTQRRVWLLFLTGILLPSLLLGYLAFRGIRNDQALIEKQKADSQRRTADVVTAALIDRIEATERDFHALGPNPRDGFAPAQIHRLSEFALEHPLVELVFLCEGTDTVRLPPGRLHFLPPGATATFVDVRSATGDRAVAAERLEFAERDYPAALAAYTLARDRATELPVRAQLTGAMARVQKKSARFADAIASYQQIADRFDQVRSAGAIPLGLAARMELAALHLATRDPSRALQTSVDLYESLVRGAWLLEEAQYGYYVQAVGTLVDGAISQMPAGPVRDVQERRLAGLREEERKQRRTAATLSPFSSGAARLIRERIATSAPAGDGAFQRFVLELGGASYLVSVQSRLEAQRRAPGEFWGLLFDPDALASALRGLLERHAAADGLAWAVAGPDREVVIASDRAPSGTSTVRAGFEGGFPNWSVELYQHGRSGLATLLGSRQGIYLYVFLLIAGILVFGLVLTVRTVSHELALAKMKSDFVSTVSHEFKSPLASVHQVAEMLQAGRVPSEERRQQYYDLLLEQSRRLCLLTDTILDLARIDEGRKTFIFETLDIAAMLRDIVPTVQDRVRHEGFLIALALEEPLPQVRADGEALGQAVTNLLDNAVKYSGQSRQVTVRASADGRHLVISIGDFGIGIAKDEISRVFDRFYRGGDELTRSVKGSGLGLTLVKEIVEAHHGTVHVESEPGQGSTFTIRLPASRDQGSGIRDQGMEGQLSDTADR